MTMLKPTNQNNHQWLRKTAFCTFVLFLGLLLSSNAYARGNYHVEVIVFKQSYTVPGSHSPSFTDTPSYAKTWPVNTAYLNSHAAKLRSSGRYEVISHTAWGQASAPYNQSAAKRFSAGGIGGFIKVFARQLLVADLKLNFEGHNLTERRRLKLNEVHYFDNEGFGVLMRVSRL